MRMLKSGPKPRAAGGDRGFHEWLTAKIELYWYQRGYSPILRVRKVMPTTSKLGSGGEIYGIRADHPYPSGWPPRKPAESHLMTERDGGYRGSSKSERAIRGPSERPAKETPTWSEPIGKGDGRPGGPWGRI